MLELTDRVTIKAAPRAVFDALIHVFSSTDNYRAWNHDHISCEWIRGRDFCPGSRMFAEEYLHGKPHRMRFAITGSEPPYGFHYKMGFPFSLACRAGFFKIKQEGDSVVLEAGLSFRFKALILFFLKKRMLSLVRHMKEEGIALREMVEKAGK